MSSSPDDEQAGDTGEGLGLAGLSSGLAGRLAQVRDVAEPAVSEEPDAADGFTKPGAPASTPRREVQLDPRALAVADRILARAGGVSTSDAAHGSADSGQRVPAGLGSVAGSTVTISGPGFVHQPAPGSSIVLGRRDEPGRLIVPHPEVSSGHLRIDRGSGTDVAVVDLDSTNGTVLVRNGDSSALVSGEPVTLIPGDQLVTGTDVLLCEVTAAEGSNS